MDSLLPFFLALAILVAVAKLSGYLAVRLHQPAVLGELLAGVILGPTVLNMLGWPAFSGYHLEETFSYLSHLGVLFLMFIAGLEIDLEAMTESGRAAVRSGALGVVMPLVLCPPVMTLFGFDLTHGVFIGLVLAATSVSISAQTLMELGALRSRPGAVLLGAAVIDDILVILLLSLFTAVTMGGGGSVLAVAWVILRMVLFIAIALLAGRWLIPKLVTWLDELPISQGLTALVIVIVLLYSWAAEALGGMAAITGAFIAGMACSRTQHRHRILESISIVAYSWLVPIFFVSIGLQTNALVLGWSGVPFALVLVLLAVVSKVVGCGLGALWGGLPQEEARTVGVGMVSRGEVGLIVATVGLSGGIIGDNVFAAAVIVVLVTTILTPLMLRALHPEPTEEVFPEVAAE